MQRPGPLLAAADFAVVVSLTAAPATAGDTKAKNAALTQVFYDFLSNPASDTHARAVRAALSQDWQSIGDYTGASKSREKFITQIGRFGNLIPDMTWAVEEMLQDGNRVIVRGRATGTPAGPLFGVDGGGKSFEIMSIDIHTIADGQIVRTYHVEDWAGALRQLK